MISFQEAREAVIVASSPNGFEDDKSYNVLLEEPLHDQVVLVDKESGEVSFEVYFNVLERLGKMRPVSA